MKFLLFLDKWYPSWYYIQAYKRDYYHRETVTSMANTKSNQQNLIPMTKDERKLATLKAQKVKEQAFKLVVKIISWESGSLDSFVIKSANKITEAEWLEYKKQRLSIATAESKDKAKEKLAITYNSIKANNGFA